MPRIINNPQIRTPSDILARASRPQNYSSFLPSHRDWRYASGVFVHEDNFDEPRQVSVWDEFDYDLQAGVFVREQRRCGRKNGGTRDRDGDVNMKMGEGDGEAEDRASWVHTLAEFRWATEGEEEGWECTRLVAVLRFSERGMRSVRRIVGEEGEADMVAPRSPFRKMGRMLAANERIRLEEDDDTPEPKGKWKDETQDFNMKMVVASLRSKEIKANGVPAAWTWFPDAVSVGTIFPPGIGLTATEIHAFYPHHVRWKDVVIRLANNGYRGPEMIAIQSFFRDTPPANMAGGQLNQAIRDTMRRAFPTFKTAEGAWEGTLNTNLFTDHLRPGRFIREMCDGYVVPTFDDLLKGLKHLPAGINARDLTQCLAWFARVKDTFTPRLELNVLHTQALVRALRQPLEPYGAMNLDGTALEEWKRDGAFATRPIENEPTKRTGRSTAVQRSVMSQMELNFKTESIKLHINVPVRHIFTFPFLSLLGMAAKALETGIAKAEEKRDIRLAAREKKKHADRKCLSSKTASDVSTSREQDAPAKRDMSTAGLWDSYRIPKRIRYEDDIGSEIAMRSSRSPDADAGSHFHSSDSRYEQRDPYRRPRTNHHTSMPYRPRGTPYTEYPRSSYSWEQDRYCGGPQYDSRYRGDHQPDSGYRGSHTSQSGYSRSSGPGSRYHGGDDHSRR